MRILHIDDCEKDRELASELIRRTKHWIYSSASSIKAGLVKWRLDPPQVVLIDVNFVGRPESETLDSIHEMSQESVVIALSGNDTQDVVNRCHNAGVASFINKRALSDPQSFHDAIMSGLDANLKRATSGELAPLTGLLNQIAKAVLWGNGEPGLLSRTSTVETKVDDVKLSMGTMQTSQDTKFTAIFKKLDEKKLEDRIRGGVLIIGMALLVYRTVTGQPTAEIEKAIEHIEAQK